MEDKIELFFKEQLVKWEMARQNYDLLHGVKVKKIRVGNTDIKIQFNPKRITSSSAKVDKKSIQERACFLCAENRPDVQSGIPFKDKYEILVNPFPIFPKHFTIPDKNHTLQTMENRIEDMLDLAEMMDEYVVFYNGPQCGASAPDHFHFQAGNKGFLPLEVSFDDFFSSPNNDEILSELQYPCSALAIRSWSKEKIRLKFEQVTKSLKKLDVNQKELLNDEPMMNLLCWKLGEEWILIIVPRALHRPSVYFANDENNMMISPAAVDMGGVFITPRESDFQRLNSDILEKIISEVCLDNESLKDLVNFINQ